MPAGWAVKRLRFLAQVQTGIAKGKDVQGIETIRVPYLRVANVQDGFIDIDDVSEIEIAATDLGRYLLRPGDVLMNEGGDFDKLGRGQVWNGAIDPCIHQNHVFAVRPHGIEPEWLALVTSADCGRFFFMTRAKQSTNLASISSTNLLELPVPCPPPAERRAIMRFLDRETGKLDALVAEQERLIALLKEKRQAVVSQAVTKGLDASAHMKDSGVAWLGQVPTHWEVAPLKHLADFINGEAFKPTEWSDDGTPIIRIQNLNGGDDFNCYNGEVNPRHHVQKGDLLFGWSGNRGTSFGPFVWPREGLHYLNQHIFKVEPRGCNVGWFYWCLRAVTIYVEEQAHGIIGMVHVTKGVLGAIPVPLPPPAEQTAIAAFLDRKTGDIDTLTSEAHRAIALLRERRAALVSAAVTGKIDVRGVIAEPAAEAA